MLTLESVRPGQTAKGSFKNSKSKGKTQVFVPIKKIKDIKTQISRHNRNSSLNPKKLAFFVFNLLGISMSKSKDLQVKLKKIDQNSRKNSKS